MSQYLPKWVANLDAKCDVNGFTWYMDLIMTYIVCVSILTVVLIIPVIVMGIYACFCRKRKPSAEKNEELSGPSEVEADGWEKDGKFVYNVFSALKPVNFIDDLLASNVSETHISKRPQAVGFRADAESQTDPVFIYDEESTMGSTLTMDTVDTQREKENDTPVTKMSTQRSVSKEKTTQGTQKGTVSKENTHEKGKTYSTMKTGAKLSLWKPSRDAAAHNKKSTRWGRSTEPTSHKFSSHYKNRSATAKQIGVESGRLDKTPASAMTNSTEKGGSSIIARPPLKTSKRK